MLATLLIALALVSCGQDLIVPSEEPSGTITGSINYVNPDASWPPDSAIFDIRFVAMRFIPTDTADFLQLNRLEISNSLRTQVDRDSFLISDVDPGFFPYSGVAYRFSTDLFDWKPVGLYSVNDGTFSVTNGDTTYVTVTVDFSNPPIFPPQ